MKRQSPLQPTLSGPQFRKLVDGQLKEAPWQKQVGQLLDLHRYWWMHIPSNVVVCEQCHHKNYRGIQRGFPDILAIRPPFILWIELKTERGTVEPEQREVGAMLLECGQIWIVARPRDRQTLLTLIAHPETFVP